MADLRSYVIGLAVTADNLAAPSNDISFTGTFGFYFDGTNWDRIRGDATDGMLVNLGANNDVTVTGTVTVDSELPAAVSLADNTSNPSVPGVGAFLMGWDGANWDRISAVAGRFQVDVITGGGVETPTTPATDYVTSSALGAGSEANLDTGDLPAKKLWKVTAWSSVAYRARVFLVNNSVEDTEALAVGGGQAHQAWSWTPPHRNWTTLGTSAGTDAFRVEMTNLDDSNAADVHAVFNYADN